MKYLGLDVPQERHHAEQHAQNIDGVVAVMHCLACATAVLADLLVGLDGAREGRGDEHALEVFGVGAAGVAGRRGEDVDEAEDEVSRERATKIANAAPVSMRCLSEGEDVIWTYVASRVM